MPAHIYAVSTHVSKLFVLVHPWLSATDSSLSFVAADSARFMAPPPRSIWSAMEDRLQAIERNGSILANVRISINLGEATLIVSDTSGAEYAIDTMPRLDNIGQVQLRSIEHVISLLLQGNMGDAED
jgi:hypothetical protein